MTHSLDEALEHKRVLAQQVASLIPHPATPCNAIGGVEVTVRCLRGGDLGLSYTILKYTDRLRIPAVSAPVRMDGLWRHTCVEAFVACKGDERYHEFNFSHSGAWAAYAFTAYRSCAAPEFAVLAPGISVSCFADRLQLAAKIHAKNRCPDLSARQLQLGISAVIEDKDGSLSYWALKHPVDRPDFHHRDAFALELEIPDVV